MKAILRKEYLVFKNSFVSYLCIWTLFPMGVYLLVSIPLSFFISLPSGINYLNWSSVGNWIVTSTLMSLFISLNFSGRYQSKKSLSSAMLYGPTSNGEHLITILFCALVSGLAQLCFSMLITLSLKSGNLYFLDLMLAALYIIPIILVVSNIGILIGFFIRSFLVKSFVVLFFLIFILFSSGVFIPLSIDLPILFKLSPLYLSVSNVQSIMSNDPTSISSSIILLFISLLVFIVNLFYCSKVFRK